MGPVDGRFHSGRSVACKKINLDDGGIFEKWIIYWIRCLMLSKCSILHTSILYCTYMYINIKYSLLYIMLCVCVSRSLSIQCAGLDIASFVPVGWPVRQRWPHPVYTRVCLLYIHNILYVYWILCFLSGARRHRVCAKKRRLQSVLYGRRSRAVLRYLYLHGG